MSTTLIKIPVSSFRKIHTPYDLPEVGTEKSLEETIPTKTYVAVVNVKDVPEEFDEWRKINVRDPKLTSGVAKKIAKSLDEEPKMFFFKNRGITLIADKTSFDNKTNELSIEFGDKEFNGLLDGGHTFRVIREHVEQTSKEELEELKAYVKIEILEGVKDKEDVVSIVEARNTSTQVKEQSTQELLKKFDAIKNVLIGTDYAERIAYKEYELNDEGLKKDIDIKEILSYLICFDVEEYGDSKHPIKAYSGKSQVISHFTNSNHERMMKYVELLPMILELRDRIYLRLPDAYNNLGGKFGALTGVRDLSSSKRMKKIELPYLGTESKYRIPSAFIYPILASFRNLVECDKNKCEWKKDPTVFLEDVIEDLAERVGAQAKELRNPGKLGKDQATWRSCFDRVQLEILKRNI